MTLAWGSLLHDVGKPPTFRVAERIRFDGHVDVGVKMAEVICNRLRFSNEETAQILALVDNHMRFADAMRMNQSTLKKFMRLRCFEEHLTLHRADCLASHRNLATYDFLQRKMQEIPPETIRPKPLVTGDDLIAAGHAPGPKFREILNAVEDAQLEGRLLSRDAASADAEGLLQGLRRMRNEGTISQDEYDAARKKLAARAAAPMSSARPAVTAPRPAPGEQRARPGFDLTGAPLPHPDERAPGQG